MPLRRRPDEWSTGRNRFDHPALYYQPPKQLRRFRTGVAVVVSVLLAFALWLGLWFATATYIKVKVKNWADDNGNHGIIAGYGLMQMSGFPARVRITLSEPRFDGPFLGRGVAWQGQSVVIEARPWWPFSLNLDVSGNHQFDVAGLGKMTAEADALTMKLIPGDGWAESLDVEAENVTVDGAVRAKASALSLAVEHNPEAQAGGNGLRVRLHALGANVPATWTPGLDGTLQSLDLSARMSGEVRPGPLVERLTAWARGGGAVDVESFKLRGHSFAMVTSGTVALDKDLQPIASFSAKFEGLFKMLHVLSAQGYVRSPDVVAATLNLAALSKRPNNGGAKTINLSLTVQDGRVNLGNEKIMDFAPIGWGMARQPEPEPESAPVKDYKDVPPIF